MRRLLPAILLFLFLSLTLYASNHPPVTFLDKDGNSVIEQAKAAGQTLVINGITYYKGEPYSPKQTCGACHDYDAMTHAYHFQIGATEVSDNWGKEHPDFHYPYLKSPGQFGFW